MSDEAALQERINREVAEGVLAEAELRRQGLSGSKIRDLWLLFSGVDPADLPHGHDEGD